MVDLSEIAIKGATDALKDVVKDIVKSTAKFAQKEYKKLLIDFEGGFGTFLDRNHRRLSRIKTLLNPSTPVSLEATYVAPNLRCDDKLYTEEQFLSLLPENRFAVITGIGGSGKSVFLKHLYVRFYQEKLGRIPFFVELRNIKPEVTLIDHMFGQLSAVAETAFDNELFRYAMKSGKFVFLLDGFDEIDTSSREELAKQILQLSYEFSENAIVLTSRPDGPFDSWDEFVVMKMEPFNKKQVLSLISRMRYDKTVKNDFARRVRETIFQSHANYLSNPLLATLMLLTFDQGAEIPTRMHVFF